MDTIFHMGPQAGGVERDNHLPCPAVHHFSDAVDIFLYLPFIFSVSSYDKECSFLGFGQLTHQLCGENRGAKQPLLAFILLVYFASFCQMSLSQAATLKSSHTQSYFSLCNLSHGQDLQDLSTHIHPSSWADSTPVLLCGLQSSQVHSDNKVCPRAARPLVQ